jgi:hypothetical protein
VIDLFQAFVQAVQDLFAGKADRRQGLILAGAILIGFVLLAVVAISLMLSKGR